ncbi:hypothetical protein Tco_0488908 [Tanacetum coccineum]
MSVLLDDQMNSVINCLTAKSTCDDLILYHEGPSEVKESRVMDLKLCYNTFKFKEGETLTQTFTRYKALMNELVNDGIKLSKLEINTGFINGLPNKWLSFCQSLRNTNHVKDSDLASLFATPLSTAFFSTFIVQDFQDSPDDEEDTRSSQEYLNDLKKEYQARALLAKSKRFFKKSKPLSPSHHKPELWPTKDFKANYNKVKAKLALLSSSASASKATTVKNKGLIAEAYEWDEEEVSFDDNEMVEVKVLMALAEDNDAVSKEGARNGEWVKISMRKVHTLLEMEDNDDRKTYLDYLCNYLNYVEEQKINLLAKHKNIVQELNTCKEQLLVLKQAKLDFLTMQHVNTEILKENQNLRKELKELTAITETWLNNLNKLMTQKYPYQVLKDPCLSEAEGFILPNHDTGRILPPESQTNTTEPPVAVTDSSTTNYDSADESSVCSTPLSPLKKLAGAEPVSGPKTIKSILKSNSTFKAEILKNVSSNEPSSAPAKGNKNSSALKVNSAPASKLKRVKIKEDPPLAIIMKELNDLKLQFNKNQSSYSRNNQPQQCDIRKPIWYMDSGCSRHMTGVKSYLHKYEEQPGSKVVFGDDSTCTLKVMAPSNVMFDKKRGTIFNSNKEIVMIALRARDVYVLDMTSSAQEPSSTQEENKLKKPITSHLMKALMLSNSQNLQLTTFNIAESERYPPDEYYHPYEPSQRYQTNSNNVIFIEPYECPEPVVLETEVLNDQNYHNDQNDQIAQNDNILNDDQSKHSNHTNDKQIIDNLPNTEDI